MKILVILLLTAAFAFAGNFDYLEPTAEETTLTIKSSVNGTLYFTCKDNSTWEVYRTDERDQTWAEWFRGRNAPQITPGADFDPGMWSVGDTVQVYPIEWITHDGETSLCKYVMYNLRCEELAFLKTINLHAIVANAEDHAYKQGYSHGYTVGYATGQALSK
ncbi:MAG: hypothetical protein SP1CHLAM54_06150 [Chlamydiia bacterium]|nr:hypothetical protein [Chlamydiia bacterium]MCH9615525.1 hypothetical protein [Chlamydiia bacterium]MCH9629180.1 hypothetical protein [Chlamydiia bacterium]